MKYDRELMDAYAEINSMWFSIPPKRKQEICEAKRDGRLVVPSYKVGDIVYRLCGTKNSRYVGDRIASAITINKSNKIIIHSTADDILGKTVFLTAKPPRPR